MARTAARRNDSYPPSRLLSLSGLQVVDIYAGAVVKHMRGHYSQVNTCCFHPFLQELYSGSGDTEILAWTPPPPASLLDNEDDGDDAGDGDDMDGWSSDDAE